MSTSPRPAKQRPSRQKPRTRNDLVCRSAIEAHGVRIGVAANSPEALDLVMEKIADVLPAFRTLTKGGDVDHQFSYIWNPSGRDTLYKDDETLYARRDRDFLLDFFGSRVRLTAAENAVDRVFVHAGVVCWKGRAIIMPASSFRGKTTLTAELVRRGAVYYSDEYAILDSDGFVHPFPKKLSIRGEVDAYRQVDHPVESFGGVTGTDHSPIGMVLLTEHRPNGKWDPRILSPAKGLMEIIKHTLPIRRDPQFTLDLLGKVAESTPIVKSKRGDAVEAVGQIIGFFEEKCMADPK